MSIVHCKNCNANIELPDGYSKPFIKCPTCQKMTGVTVAAKPATGSRPAVSSQPVPSGRPAAHSAPPPVPRATARPSVGHGEAEEPLPEVMKANKRIAGKPCVACGKPFQLGESVHNCQSCSQSNHQNCWNKNQGCGNASCSANAASSSQQTREIAMQHQANEGLPEGGPKNTVPCRWCKEPIMRGARKCKHCDEFQNDVDREQMTQSTSEFDNDLTTVEWIFVILCPCIGCIMGIVYSSQGKPKGKKAILWSIAFNIFWSVINAGLKGH